MNDELMQMLQEYLDMDAERRNYVAQEASNAILNLFEEIFDGDKMFEAYLEMFSIFSSVDGQLAKEEYDLFINITGTEVSYEDFFDALQNELESANVEEFFDFINSQEEEIFGAFCMLAICIFTCDGTFSEEELEFFEAYFLE